MSHYPALYTPILLMLFLLFLYYLLHGASINAGPIPTIQNRSSAGNHCNDLAHCRTIWNIIWSCLVTIFSCTWVAVHPNVPRPQPKVNSWIERRIWNPLLSFVEHRLPLFVCALILPEYVLAWAIRQYLRARQIANGECKHWVKFLSIASILSKSLLERERRLSMTHGFFIIMGGFHLFEHGSVETINNEFKSHDDDIPLHPLSFSDLCDDTTIDFTSFTVPTEEEIEDKAKSDKLAKALVLLQTSWFVVQCIARAKEHLLITHLEIVTLAYAAMNFVIYLFWWNKPLNVDRPVRVFRRPEPRGTPNDVTESTSGVRELTWKAIGNGFMTIHRFIAGVQDDHVNLSHENRVPIFWANNSGKDAVKADLMVLWVGTCFGAIHCTAWDFSFPTHTELRMWRVMCVAITAVPIYSTFGFFLSHLLRKKDLERTRIFVLFFCTIFAGILYILARMVTLALAFTSLRDLPPGMYETVHWTTFIPHV